MEDLGSDNDSKMNFIAACICIAVIIFALVWCYLSGIERMANFYKLSGRWSDERMP